MDLSSVSPHTSLRAETTGIGSLLTTLRNHSSTPETLVPNSSVSAQTLLDVSGEQKVQEFEDANRDITRPLNRKEKRALLKLSRQEETVTVKERVVPEFTPIPTNLLLRFSDEASYQNYTATFGYQSSRHNNFVQMVFQNKNSTCTVTGAQDRIIRAYRMENDEIRLDWKRNTGGLILDMCWEKSSGNLFSTSKYRPIQLFDEKKGELLQSYAGKDSGDNVKEALSIGQVQNSLIGGFKGHFQIWDVSIGGKSSSTLKYFDSNYNTGITGHSMSVCSHPTMSDLFASAGTSSRVAIYSLNWKSAVSTMEGSSRGYTHVSVSQDGTKVYASERTGDIHCFDTRMNTLIQVLKREMQTAHRTRFEIEETGRFLFSGTSSGDVVVYNLNTYEEETQPVFHVSVSSSCVPCVSIKNKQLAVCTGQRWFYDNSSSSENESNETEKQESIRNSFQLFEVG